MHVNVEYDEFDNIEDVFMYLASATAPLKNTMPVSSYKDHVMAFVPIGSHGAERFLMIYAKGSLDAGIYEFDVSTKTCRLVKSVERADKFYFVVLTPIRNTLADKALKNI